MADRPSASRKSPSARRIGAIVGFLLFAGMAGVLIARLRAPEPAPASTYRGVIRDAATGQPLTNATVELITPGATITQTSDSDGVYLLLLPADQRPDRATLRIAAPGYAPYEQVVALSSTSAELGEVNLEPTAALAAPSASPTAPPAGAEAAPSAGPAPTIPPDQIYPNGGPLPADLPPLDRERVAQIQERVRWGRGRADELAFSPDGRLLAVSTSTGIYIHTVPSMDVVQVITDTDGFSNMALSPDGRLLAIGGHSRITLWDIETGQPQQTINEPIERVQALAFSPDGNLLASGSRDGAIRIWSVPGLRLQQSFQNPKAHEGIQSLAFSADGQRLLSATAEKHGQGMDEYTLPTVTAWDMSLGQPVGVSAQPENPCVSCLDFSSLGFSADGSTYHAVISSKLYQWETETGDLLQEHDLDIVMVQTALGPTGEFIVAGGDEAGLVLVRIDDGERLELLPPESRPLPWEVEIAVAVSPDGKTIASITDYKNTVNLWDVAQGAIVQREEYGLPVSRGNAAISANGRTLAIQSGSVTFRSWSLPDGTTQPDIDSAIDYSFEQLALSADGERAITSGYGALVWDLTNGSQQQSMESKDEYGGTANNGPIAFAPDGERFFVAIGMSLQVWDAQSGALERTVELDAAPEQLLISPDGSTLISVGADQMSVALDTASFEQRYTVDGAAMTFSGDSRVLAGRLNTDTIQLWEAATGQPRGTVQVEEGDTYVIALNRDGTLLASGADYQGGTAIWDTATGTLVRRLGDSQGAVEAVMFSPDGSYLLSVSSGVLRFWY